MLRRRVSGGASSDSMRGFSDTQKAHDSTYEPVPVVAQ